MKITTGAHGPRPGSERRAALRSPATATHTDCRLTAINLGPDFKKQLGSMDWVFAPQLTAVPFRGKLALFQSIYMDTDLYFFAGPAFVGVQERKDCPAGRTARRTRTGIRTQRARRGHGHVRPRPDLLRQQVERHRLRVARAAIRLEHGRLRHSRWGQGSGVPGQQDRRKRPSVPLQPDADALLQLLPADGAPQQRVSPGYRGNSPGQCLRTTSPSST